MNALIGSTGFVGGNLQAQAPFHEFYRSTNIDDIRGKSFDLIVCAGAPAVKWKANKEPLEDKQSLQKLENALAAAKAKHVVLISTVDVYPNPIGVDESIQIDPEIAQPYGKHRFQLERFVESRFSTTVIRLPGLFGPGLKKNIIFDFLNKNAVDQINCESVFQFYDTRRLWADIELVRRAGLSTANFATEPVSVKDVALQAFGMEFSGVGTGAPVRYDLQTRNAGVWKRSGRYMMTRREVLDAMKDFVDNERKAKS